MRRPCHITPKSVPIAVVTRREHERTPEARAEREQRIAELRAEHEQAQKVMRERAPKSIAPTHNGLRRDECQRRYRESPKGKLTMKLSRIRREIRDIDATGNAARFARRRERLAGRLEAALADLDRTAEGRATS